jgi:hypothetical protein
MEMKLFKQLKIKLCKDFDTNRNFNCDEYIIKYYDRMIKDFQDEILRKEKFELIFPKYENIEYYSKFLKTPGDDNIALWKVIRSNII